MKKNNYEIGLLVFIISSIVFSAVEKRSVSAKDDTLVVIPFSSNAHTLSMVPKLNNLGFEEDLFQLLSDHLKKKVVIRKERTLSQAQNSLSLGFVDLITLPLSQKATDYSEFLKTEPFLKTHYCLISNYKTSHFPNQDNFLIKKLGVPHNIYRAKLHEQISNIFLSRPPRIIISDSQKILRQLSNKKIDYAVLPVHHAKNLTRFFPNTKIGEVVGNRKELRWVVSKSQSILKQSLDDFLGKVKSDGTLLQLEERYFGHLDRLKNPDIVAFLKKIKSTLPKYLKDFQEAGELYKIDWRLTAALGYQESHWDPKAVSPTGVKGLMMLTIPTSNRLGVTDRLDPKQNIFAATRYIEILKSNLPQKILEPDRTWMALASYNVGLGHVEDARILAERFNLNPNHWVSIRRTLPLLSREKHYSTLKRGYARGGEAVALVESVRNYYEIITNEIK